MKPSRPHPAAGLGSPELRRLLNESVELASELRQLYEPSDRRQVLRNRVYSASLLASRCSNFVLELAQASGELLAADREQDPLSDLCVLDIGRLASSGIFHLARIHGTLALPDQTPALRFDVRRQPDGKYRLGLRTSASHRSLQVAMTQPRFGGSRYWFECPEPGCGKRVLHLYTSPDLSQIACRRCLHLRYDAEHSRPDERARATLQVHLDDLHRAAG